MTLEEIKNFGWLLRAYRVICGMSAQEFAQEAFGVSGQTLIRYEKYKDVKDVPAFLLNRFQNYFANMVEIENDLIYLSDKIRKTIESEIARREQEKKEQKEATRIARRKELEKKLLRLF